jgi:uncharacterized protein (TIGR03066 family)
MRSLHRVYVSVVALAVVGLSMSSSSAEAQQKDAPKQAKLVGTWKCTKVSANSFLREPGFIYEFAEDGKFKLNLKDGVVFAGTYTVNGDKVTLLPEFVVGDKKKAEKTWKVTTLTDAELEIQDNRDTAAFQRQAKK